MLYKHDLIEVLDRCAEEAEDNLHALNHDGNGDASL